MGDQYSACVNDCWALYSHGCSGIKNTNCSCSFNGLITEAFGNCLAFECSLYDCTQSLSDWNNACASSSYPNPFPNLYPCLRAPPPSTTSSSIASSSRSSSSSSSSTSSFRSNPDISTTSIHSSPASSTIPNSFPSISTTLPSHSLTSFTSLSTTSILSTSSAGGVYTPLPQRESVTTYHPLGAILGGTMSGVIVLMLIGWLFWRRRRRKQEEEIAIIPYDQEGATPRTDRTPSTPDMRVLEILDPEKAALAAYGHPRPSPHIREEMQEAPQASLLFTHLGESSDQSNPTPLQDQPSPSYLMLSPPPQYASPASTAHPLHEPPSWMAYDALSEFVNANRDIISPGLELKLRGAEYTPDDNPADVSPEIWMERYNVGPFELRRLQQAYDRSQQRASESPEDEHSMAAHPPKPVDVT